MTGTVDRLDLSALPPAARRELRDFYEFLLTRPKKAGKGRHVRTAPRFADLCGVLTWKGDAVAEQRRLRDEW